MRPEERQEVRQLLEFSEHTAAGRMTTEFIAISDGARVSEAVDALRTFEGSREAQSTIYLTGEGQKLAGAVPLVRIAIASPSTPLATLAEEAVSCRSDTPDDEVADLFDK